MASESQTELTEAVTRQTRTDPAITAATASVLLSLYQFYVRGNREMGLFVGLWAPTILAFANYDEQTRMADQLEETLGTGEEGLRESVSRLLQGQSQQ